MGSKKLYSHYKGQGMNGSLHVKNKRERDKELLRDGQKVLET